MKRKFAILLSILSLICVLSACKNADDAHTDSAQRQRYDTAMNLWTSGQQYEAVKLLAENPAYEDSWDYIKEFYQTLLFLGIDKVFRVNYTANITETLM